MAARRAQEVDAGELARTARREPLAVPARQTHEPEADRGDVPQRRHELGAQVADDVLEGGRLQAGPGADQRGHSRHRAPSAEVGRAVTGSRRTAPSGAGGNSEAKRSAIAVIVSEGFTPRFAGIVLASAM